MDLKAEVLKHIDLKGLILDVGVALVWEKLDALAADSENKLDDMVLAAAKPLVDQYVKEALDELYKKLSE